VYCQSRLRYCYRATVIRSNNKFHLTTPPRYWSQLRKSPRQAGKTELDSCPKQIALLNGIHVEPIKTLLTSFRHNKNSVSDSHQTSHFGPPIAHIIFVQSSFDMQQQSTMNDQACDSLCDGSFSISCRQSQ
jgi:hypothetical protein